MMHLNAEELAAMSAEELEAYRKEKDAEIRSLAGELLEATGKMEDITAKIAHDELKEFMKRRFPESFPDGSI
jgi:hypothetical protein